MKITITISFIFLLCILTLSCKTETDQKTQISDEIEILLDGSKKFFDPQGMYSGLESLRFLKTTKVYNEMGGLQDSISQSHLHFLGNKSGGVIEWEKNDTLHAVYNQNGQSSKLVNDQKSLDSMDTQIADYIFKSSQFSLLMPFFISENPSGMVFLGRQVLPLLGEVDIVQQERENGKWRFYFNPINKSIAGYAIDVNNTSTLIVNKTFQQIEGLVLPKYRKTYLLDNIGKIDRLQAEGFYDKFQVNFEN